MRGSDQQPALAGLGIGDGLAEFRVLVGVAGAILGDEPARRNPEVLEQPRRKLGFRAAGHR
jgi:hypothetical protein